MAIYCLVARPIKHVTLVLQRLAKTHHDLTFVIVMQEHVA